MKCNALIVCIFSLSTLLTSCSLSYDSGYPRKVYFPKEGGERTYTGELGITIIEVADYYGDGAAQSEEQEDKTLFAESDWLIIKSPHKGSTTIQFIAEPNPNKKRRKLYVDINRAMPQTTQIVIIQD